MTYFSGYLRNKRHSGALALLFGLALCAAVAWIVFAATSKKMTPGLGKSHTGLYSLAACAFFTAWGLWIFFTKRFRVTIAQQDDGSLLLEIKDPSLRTPLVIHDPVTVTRQWSPVDLGRRNKIKMLYVTVCTPDGVPLVTFTGGLGNFYDAPEGFQQVPAGQAQTAERVYDAGHVQDIAYAFWNHADYLSRRKN